MRVGSCFSGIGGIDRGLEQADMKVVWQIEQDAACNRVLARHWPGVKRYGDITRVKAERLKPVDVLAGGFPCTDLSVAGKNAGLAGEQSRLFWQLYRLARDLAPSWILVENVPNLLSRRHARDFDAILATLVELGYGLAWRVFDAQYDGVAQRRKRVFLVGHSGGLVGRAAQVLFEPESLPGGSAPGRATGSGVAASLTGSFGRSGGNSGDERGSIVPVANGGNHIEETYVYQCHGSNVGEMGTLRSGNGHVSGGVPFVVAPLTASYGKTIGSAGNNGGVVNGVVVPFDTTQITSAQNRSRPEPGDPCHPLAAGAHPPAIALTERSRQGGMAVRRLTPVEAERLMGLPDGYTAGESDSTRYRMLGNSVAVPVIVWIGRRMLAVDAGGES